MIGEWVATVIAVGTAMTIATTMGVVADVSAEWVDARAAGRMRSGVGLRALVLDKRLRALIGVAEACVSRKEWSSMERQVVCDWRDGVVCEGCGCEFGLFRRKHHCRICGGIVCDDGCSKVVPVELLSDIVTDSTTKTKTIPSLTLRICHQCKQTILSPRLHAIAKPLRVQTHHRTYILLQDKLNRLNINKIPDDETNSRLVKLFAKLDILAKDINSDIESAKSNDERRLLHSLSSVVVSYLQEKLPKLRKAQEDKLQIEREALLAIVNSNKQHNESTIKKDTETLAVLEEQKFLLQQAQIEARSSRRFDDAKSLQENLADIESEIYNLRKTIENVL